MASVGRQTMPIGTSLLGLPPEIRRIIYRYFFSTSTFTFSNLSRASSKSASRRVPKQEKKRRSARVRLSLCFVCKTINAEITPDLVSKITVDFKQADCLVMSHLNTLLAGLQMPNGVRIKKLMMHHSHARIMWKELSQGRTSLRSIRTMTIYGDDVFETIEEVLHCSGDYLVVYRDATVFSSVPSTRYFWVAFECWSLAFTDLRQIYVQLNKEEDKVWIGHFQISDAGTVAFTEEIRPSEEALVEIRETQPIRRSARIAKALRQY